MDAFGEKNKYRVERLLHAVPVEVYGEDVVCRPPGTHGAGAPREVNLMTCAGHLSVSPAQCSPPKMGVDLVLKGRKGGKKLKDKAGDQQPADGSFSAQQTSVWVTAGYAVCWPLPTTAAC